MSKFIVVATNVPLAANLVANLANLDELPDPAFNVSNCCIRESVVQIKNIIGKRGRVLVIDDAGEILQEYMNNLSSRGQPGIGNAFLKWVNDNLLNTSKVARVKIKNDRQCKFVAVANAHCERPPILRVG